MRLVGVVEPCIGYGGPCGRPREVRCGSFCRTCWEALPRCSRCGHHLDAHDEGPCAVNAHEDATGPECECAGYVTDTDTDTEDTDGIAD